MAQKAIFNSTTGEIVAYVSVPSGDVAANTPSGHAALAVTALVDGSVQYVSSPGGTPAVATRPDFACTIPSSVLVGDPLSIPSVPTGAVVTITSTGSGGGAFTKSGGLGTLDASISGAVDGDILTVDIALFPYRPMTGECLVTGV
jgi:hypothetical protein